MIKLHHWYHIYKNTIKHDINGIVDLAVTLSLIIIYIILVIVLLKIMPKDSTVSVAKLNWCSCRHKITKYSTFGLVICFHLHKKLKLIEYYLLSDEYVG